MCEEAASPWPAPQSAPMLSARPERERSATGAPDVVEAGLGRDWTFSRRSSILSYMKVYWEEVFRCSAALPLLRASFGAEGPLPAVEIAERARVSLPHTGRILPLLIRHRLITSIPDVRPNPVYEFSPADESVTDAMTAIFHAEGFHPAERFAAARRKMIEWGAPLAMSPDTGNEDLALEEALPLAALMARHEAALITALPAVVERMRKRGIFDSKEFRVTLTRHARLVHADRHLGALLDLSGSLIGDAGIRKFARQLPKSRTLPAWPRPFRGHFRSQWEYARAQDRTPDILRKNWGFLLNMDEEAFRHHLRRAA